MAGLLQRDIQRNGGKGIKWILPRGKIKKKRRTIHSGKGSLLLEFTTLHTIISNQGGGGTGQIRGLYKKLWNFIQLWLPLFLPG